MATIWEKVELPNPKAKGKDLMDAIEQRQNHVDNINIALKSDDSQKTRRNKQKKKKDRNKDIKKKKENNFNQSKIMQKIRDTEAIAMQMRSDNE